MKSVKSFIVLCLFLLLELSATAQEQKKKDLYFELDKDKIDYSKKVFERTVTIETTRKSINYSFLIKCTCHPGGWISFLGHNNPEVSEKSEPIKIISRSAYKKLDLISFEELVKLMQLHDLSFNDKYNLYFVEPYESSSKYSLYNIRFINTFIDNQ